MDKKGWDCLDIILVSGDAYIDHPSFGVAVIGRVLESAGYRVGIIPQPDWRSTDDVCRLGKPRLFFGVTAGNTDSMVANYTANKRQRRADDYSPGRMAGLRPERSCIVYSNMIRRFFKDVPIVLGGIEASMRRLAHYDYWSHSVRRSILLDSRADILVYGMGEAQILEIARRMHEKSAHASLAGITGTALVLSDITGLDDFVLIPSFEEVATDFKKFNEAFSLAYNEADPIRGRTIVQKHAERYVVLYPPASPLTAPELDRIHELKYARGWHPAYNKKGGVPAYETVRFSVISHRGCPGECSFCSLSLHQGRIIQSRSRSSILREVRLLTQGRDFKGTISDIGGATGNLYAAHCTHWNSKGACKARQCLMPVKCRNLSMGFDESLRLWGDVMKIPGVRHVFMGSGVRYDLLLDIAARDYFDALCREHVSGQLKIAPEHVSGTVLECMNKPPVEVYERFIEKFMECGKKAGKKQYPVNYFISAHPGSTLENALELALYLAHRGLHPEQVQDFIPLPMTRSGCMYYTGIDPFTGQGVYVARTFKERKMQRALIQYQQPKNRALVMEALKILEKQHLRRIFYP